MSEGFCELISGFRWFRLCADGYGAFEKGVAISAAQMVCYCKQLQNNCE